MRPNCLCGHGYEKHGWGTTGCEVCTDHCYAYRQSFCTCGHVWESHGVVDGKPDELACPFCGITCKHWRAQMSEKTESCKCGQEYYPGSECPSCGKDIQKSPENGQNSEKLLETRIDEILEKPVNESKFCTA